MEIFKDNRIKGAIFDLDGTLLDSMSIWDKIGEDFLRSLGIEPREDLAETFQTFTLKESAEYYRAHYGITLSVSEITDRINGMIAAYYRHAVPLKSGVKDLLKKFADIGVSMCIATVTDRALAEAALERLSVRGYFSEIFTAAEIGSGKDEPTLYRTALAHLGTERADTLVFEDAFHALMTAKKDGFRTVAVYDAHETHQKEIRAIADAYITDFSSFVWGCIED